MPNVDLRMTIGEAAGYSSRLQIARVLSEKWVGKNGYCPGCCGVLSPYPNNNPAADFYCAKCNLDFELKSKHGSFGSRVVNGAYSAMMHKIRSDTAPNLLLLSYSKPEYRVADLQLVPSHFLHEGIIEPRKPLAKTARRAGWRGCNILLGKLPETARIGMIYRGMVLPKPVVIAAWADGTILRDVPVSERGWLAETMHCIEALKMKSFSLRDIYGFESDLLQRHPENKNIRPKLRQQLQKLRDMGYIRFLGRGSYMTLRGPLDGSG